MALGPRGFIMSLKVELKPGERVIIGDCVVTNTDQRTRLVIDGQAPILREKDILTAKFADTPAKRIYLAIQLMYTSRDPNIHHQVYFELVRDIMRAAPSTWAFIEGINNHIVTGDFYKALEEAKKLIAYETEPVEDAKRCAGVRSDSEAVRVISRRPSRRRPRQSSRRFRTVGTTANHSNY
jgi:flagellar protein FlbT